MSSPESQDSIKIYNDHNVYILGAGFSHDAGLPLVSEFTNKMRDGFVWLRDRGRIDEANSILEVFNFRRNAASATERVPIKTENIEELFSLASAAESSRGNHLTRAMPVAIAATLDYCLETAHPQRKRSLSTWDAPRIPEDWLRRSSGTSDGRNFQLYECCEYDLYGLVLAGSPVDRDTERRDTILTFNYDLLVEGSLQKLQIPFTYGLKKEEADFRGSDVCLTESEAKDAVRVLKLHGSINWAAPQSRGGPLTLYPTYNEVRNAGASPFLAPPTWRKVFGDQLSTIWDLAVEALHTATRVVILGYSIPATDQHFKYLLAAGLQGNISLRQIWFVNPGLNHGEASSLKSQLFSTLREDLAAQSLLQLHALDAASFLLTNPSLINRKPTKSYRF